MQSRSIGGTDDDCTVQPNWLETFASIFAAHPNVAVAFCCVEAGEHNRTAGFVPDYVRTGNRMLTTMHDARHVRGLGAGIAVRRNMIEEIGGFDPMLGPGSRFRDCDDRDIAIRALLARYHVYETSTIAVKHFGFRSWQQGRQLARRNFLGIGAAYSKFLKCGRIELMYIPAYEFIKFALWPPIRDLLHLRQARGIVRSTASAKGPIEGLRTPLDKATMIFGRGQRINSIPLKVNGPENQVGPPLANHPGRPSPADKASARLRRVDFDMRPVAPRWRDTDACRTKVREAATRV